MEGSYCQQVVTFFWSSAYNWPGPLTLWLAPPPLHLRNYVQCILVLHCSQQFPLTALLGSTNQFHRINLKYLPNMVVLC